MAFYNLNEALKEKAAKAQKKDNGEVALDDLNRVKVLSPGRQVFKRFIRNRLAVFGTIMLATLFLLCFLGPAFYPYGQKQIFYKYDAQNIDYALAKVNSSFTGYVIDSSVEVNTNANSMMTTYIKSAQAAGLNEYYALGDDGAVYMSKRLDDAVYTLSKLSADRVCVFGNNTVNIGVFDSISSSMSYENGDDLGDDFCMAAKKSCKGNSGEFEYKGTTYSFEKAAGKSYSITAETGGFLYDGAEISSSFEAEANRAAEAGLQYVDVDSVRYFITGKGGSYSAYVLGTPALAKVFTTYVIDLFDSTSVATDDLYVNALLSAFDDKEFDADGKHYTVSATDESIILIDAAGEEYGEFTNFIIRRYNGDDTVEYSLKKQLASTMANMVETKSLEASFVAPLPSQNDVGEYNYDEDGNLLYNDTELRIKQKDTGMFVINCDQIIYVIDRFASPSWSHILGTDGDGFDVFARIMNGGRISLMVGFVVVILETFLGVIMGGLAGYYGGWVDMIIMRLVDIFYCLPSTPIMIILGAMMDALRLDTYIRLLVMMAMLGVLGWAGVARLVRGQILSLREQEFMVATEATGIRVKDRIFKHLVPNVMPQLIVSATMGMGGTILTESTLSYLGLGVKHPLATWGTMINSVSSASAMAHYAYIWIPVGVLISLTVIAFNFVGDGLRDAYDPKSKR